MHTLVAKNGQLHGVTQCNYSKVIVAAAKPLDFERLVQKVSSLFHGKGIEQGDECVETAAVYSKGGTSNVTAI